MTSSSTRRPCRTATVRHVSTIAESLCTNSTSIFGKGASSAAAGEATTEEQEQQGAEADVDSCDDDGNNLRDEYGVMDSSGQTLHSFQRIGESSPGNDHRQVNAGA